MAKKRKYDRWRHRTAGQDPLVKYPTPEELGDRKEFLRAISMGRVNPEHYAGDPYRGGGDLTQLELLGLLGRLDEGGVNRGARGAMPMSWMAASDPPTQGLPSGYGAYWTPPQSSRWGTKFNPVIKSDIGGAASHELGHEAFNLRGGMGSNHPLITAMVARNQYVKDMAPPRRSPGGQEVRGEDRSFPVGHRERLWNTPLGDRFPHRKYKFQVPRIHPYRYREEVSARKFRPQEVAQHTPEVDRVEAELAASEAGKRRAEWWRKYKREIIGR